MTDRTYGIEIEMIGVSRFDVARALNAAGISCSEGTQTSRATWWSWLAKLDGSLTGTLNCELVSPILRGEEGLAMIRRVCDLLNSLHASVD